MSSTLSRDPKPTLTDCCRLLDQTTSHLMAALDSNAREIGRLRVALGIARKYVEMRESELGVPLPVGKIIREALGEQP